MPTTKPLVTPSPKVRKLAALSETYVVLYNFIKFISGLPCYLQGLGSLARASECFSLERSARNPLFLQCILVPRPSSQATQIHNSLCFFQHSVVRKVCRNSPKVGEFVHMTVFTRVFTLCYPSETVKKIL